MNQLSHWVIGGLQSYVWVKRILGNRSWGEGIGLAKMKRPRDFVMMTTTKQKMFKTKANHLTVLEMK